MISSWCPRLAPGNYSLVAGIGSEEPLQLLCLSIIGWSLTHIYDEVKRRPSIIVESSWVQHKNPRPRIDALGYAGYVLLATREQ